MAVMFISRPAWIPAGVNLSGLIVTVSEDLKRFPPFGTDGTSRNILRSQVEYGGMYYRVDIENITGVNLKE